VNVRPFLVDALGAALELGIGTPDDVLRHITPDVLATHLPRPLWARLLTAALGAPRVDAQLVVETVGVANLVEHVPGAIVWACVAELGARSLGRAPEAFAAAAALRTSNGAAAMVGSPAAAVGSGPAPASSPATSREPARSVLAPPPEPAPAPRALEPAPTPPVSIPSPAVNQPLADLVSELDQDDRPIVAKPRTTTGQRFRPSSTGVGGRLGSRRPMASAAPAPAPAPPPARSSRRVATEVTDEPVLATDLDVDDSQLVEWRASETTNATDD
jgi:hypothetical protein